MTKRKFSCKAAAGLLLSMLPVAVFASADEGVYDTLKLPSFIPGVCTHFGFMQGTLTQNLSMMQQAGVLATRDEMTWGRVEAKKDTFAVPDFYTVYLTEAQKRGIYTLNILDYGNKLYDGGDYPHSPEAVEGYTRYSENLVKEFKGKARLFQVWNEWDGGCGMSQFKGKNNTPEYYVNLLKATYPRIKAANPDAVVVSNSICTGDKALKAHLDQGMIKYCDIVGLHTYNYHNGTPADWYTRMLGVDKMLREYSGGKEVPLFITEMGYPTHISSGGNDPETSASYLARIYFMAKTLPFIKGIWWYDFQDDGWKAEYNENNFGIVRGDLTPKPAYYVLSDITDILKNGQFAERIDVKDPGVWILRFKMPEGKQALVMWSEYENDDMQITLRNSASDKKAVTVRHAGMKSYSMNWGCRDWLADRTQPISPDKLQFSVRGRPFIMEGNLDAVTVEKMQKRDYAETARVKGSTKLVLPRLSAIAAPAGKEKKVYEFGLERNYKGLNVKKWGGKNDLDAKFSASYDRNALYIEVTVTDDTFFQEKDIEDAWEGDGLQLALIQAQAGITAKNRMELDVALTKNGPQAYLRNSPDGKAAQITSDVKVKIERKDKLTVYKIEIPFAKFGMQPLEKGSLLGFSMLVNDNDGTNGREGWLEWGGGIGQGKDPMEYNLLIME